MGLLYGAYPDLPDEYLIEIGRVSVRWSMLETMLHFALIKFAGLDDREGRSHAIFHHMAFPQRLDVLGTILSEMIDSPASQEVREQYAKIKVLLDESAKRRNELIHAEWGIDNEQVTKSKISARGSFKVSVKPISVEEIREAAAIIYKTTLALSGFTLNAKIKRSSPQEGQ